MFLALWEELRKLTLASRLHYAYEKVSTHPGYPYHYAYEKASTHPGHSGSLLFATPSGTYERCGVRKVSKSEIPVFRCCLILFACEINIKFNSTFFFFDENIQIICLK
jgi:hypothetical protein